MIARVFDDNYEKYYCTLCNRPFQALREATEHAGFCGQAVPIQPVFRSYTTAATFEEDDDIQDYKKPWVGLTDAEIDALWGSWMRPYAQMVSDKLRDKNT